MEATALKTWFTREILSHEAALVRYLNRAWPKRDEIHDLRQDIYIRVYEAAAKSRPSISPKTFLFQTARNLMIDRLRRARVVSIEAVGDPDALNALVDEVSPERHISARQELKRFAQALRLLPPRCREVIWLRRVDEITQKEVAEQLGISVRTVEVHVLNGMRLLAEAFLNQNNVQQPNKPDSIETKAQHGQQTD